MPPEDDLSVKRAMDFVEATMRSRLEGFIGKPKVEVTEQIRAQVERFLMELIENGGDYEALTPQFDIEVKVDPENPDVFVHTITGRNEAASRVLHELQLQHPEIFGPPAVDYILMTFEIDKKETEMEKNGNTFTPGEKVASTQTTGKVASTRTGTVQPESSEGRMKVSWDDGTTSWEDPGTLKKG